MESQQVIRLLINGTIQSSQQGSRTVLKSICFLAGRGNIFHQKTPSQMIITLGWWYAYHSSCYVVLTILIMKRKDPGASCLMLQNDFIQGPFFFHEQQIGWDVIGAVCSQFCKCSTQCVHMHACTMLNFDAVISSRLCFRQKWMAWATTAFTDHVQAGSGNCPCCFPWLFLHPWLILLWEKSFV